MTQCGLWPGVVSPWVWAEKSDLGYKSSRRLLQGMGCLLSIRYITDAPLQCVANKSKSYSLKKSRCVLLFIANVQRSLYRIAV